jgi:Tol biopolymer transport system component
VFRRFSVCLLLLSLLLNAQALPYAQNQSGGDSRAQDAPKKAEPEAVKKFEPWDVEGDHGPARTVEFDTDEGTWMSVDVSPDGQAIVFDLLGDIYRMPAAGGRAELVSGGVSFEAQPRFSPDGRKVLYVSRGYLGKDASRLVERDLATGQEKVLVDWPALNYNPVYSPDASEVAFTSNITGDWVIYRQRLADGRSWRVTFGPGSARAPDYKPVR